jgi:uncharacterized protein DUF1552
LARRVFEGLQSFLLQIDKAQIVLHKADQPDANVDFLDTDGLARQGFAEIDFLPVKADAAAAGDDHGSVVKRIVRIGNCPDRTLEVGVSQESFGSSIHENMSWAGPDRPLAPEEIPHRLFDRLFGAKDQGWLKREHSILDAVYQDVSLLRQGLPKEDAERLDEHFSSVRDLERAITSLPPRIARWPVRGSADYNYRLQISS